MVELLTPIILAATSLVILSRFLQAILKLSQEEFM
jgi:hypothetical protein